MSSNGAQVIHAEYLGTDLTIANCRDKLAMYYTIDSLPSFIGTFEWAAGAKSSVLIDAMTLEEITASDATKPGKLGFAGRWLIMDPERLGECFKPKTGPCSGKLCVVLAPRYFLKHTTKSETLGQILAVCKPLENRPPPTRSPDQYIYTTGRIFKKLSYRFAEYDMDDLHIGNSEELAALVKSSKIKPYVDPYSALMDALRDARECLASMVDTRFIILCACVRTGKQKNISRGPPVHEIDSGDRTDSDEDDVQNDGKKMSFIHENIDSILEEIGGSLKLQEQIDQLSVDITEKEQLLVETDDVIKQKCKERETIGSSIVDVCTLIISYLLTCVCVCADKEQETES
jgi:hypothetical protein